MISAVKVFCQARIEGLEIDASLKRLQILKNNMPLAMDNARIAELRMVVAYCANLEKQQELLDNALAPRTV